MYSLLSFGFGGCHTAQLLLPPLFPLSTLPSLQLHFICFTFQSDEYFKTDSEDRSVESAGAADQPQTSSHSSRVRPRHNSSSSSSSSPSSSPSEGERARKRIRLDTTFTSLDLNYNLETMGDTHSGSTNLPSIAALTASGELPPQPASNGDVVMNGYHHNGTTITASNTPSSSSSSSLRKVERAYPGGTTIYPDSNIDRTEFVRLVIQSLKDIGYRSVPPLLLPNMS